MRMVPSRHIHMTAKNFPSIGPMLKKRSSSPRGVGTVSRGRPSNRLKATRRKSIPRSVSTHSRFGSSQLNSTSHHTHNCTHSQDLRCNLKGPSAERWRSRSLLGSADWHGSASAPGPPSGSYFVGDARPWNRGPPSSCRQSKTSGEHRCKVAGSLPARPDGQRVGCRFEIRSDPKAWHDRPPTPQCEIPSGLSVSLEQDARDVTKLFDL
jgi:hypothetical protein